MAFAATNVDRKTVETNLGWVFALYRTKTMEFMSNKSFPKSAFIFCAGRGERLRPLTDSIPKPLLPIAGKPVLEIILDKFISAGIKEFIVNTWHLGEKFSEHFCESSNEDFKQKIFARLEKYPDSFAAENLKKSLSFCEYAGAQIVCVAERELLGQGGGLKNIIPILDLNHSLAIHNGDILLDSPILDFLEFSAAEFEKSVSEISENNAESEISACLFLRAEGALKNVGVVSQPKPRVRDLRFTTKRVCEKYLQFAGFFVAFPKFLSAVKNVESEKFSTVDVMLELTLDCENSISYFEENRGFFADMGTLDDYKMCDARQRLLNIGFSPVGVLRAIAKGGSMREFFRFEDADKGELVACFYSPQKRENFLYCQIADFLNSADFPVPEILFHGENLIVMRDGGKIDLSEICGGRDNFCAIKARPLYVAAVLEAKKLHTSVSEKYFELLSRAEAPELSEEFSENLYDWEHGYFFEEFAKNFAKSKTQKPLEDFAALKKNLLSQKKVLLHRDLQSQNLVVRDGKVSFIDFQGMRLGCALYDLASLLLDPYVNLPKSFCDEMLEVYFCGEDSECKKSKKEEGDFSRFEKNFYIAGAQRLMQALGAYAFLAMKKGKPEYFNHMEFALNFLSESARKAGLLQICEICEEISPRIAVLIQEAKK